MQNCFSQELQVHSIHQQWTKRNCQQCNLWYCTRGWAVGLKQKDINKLLYNKIIIPTNVHEKWKQFKNILPCFIYRIYSNKRTSRISAYTWISAHLKSDNINERTSRISANPGKNFYPGNLFSFFLFVLL